MKKIIVLFVAIMLNACTTEYILMDESHNPVQDGYYTENGSFKEMNGQQTADNSFLNIEDDEMFADDRISANDVFVVKEGMNFVTYQYKNVRVDEVSPLASLYCADTISGASPYLREVSIFHNGFMQATFDCLNVAI